MKEQNREAVINGVDVIKLKETIRAIGESPSLAAFKFRITNEWQGGGLNRSIVKASYGAGQDFKERDGKFTMEADEPQILLSGDKAANPVEHLLHALAGCVTTTAVYHAAARKIPLKGVESTLEGDLDLRGFLGMDSSIPKGYKSIVLRMRITGDLTDEQKREVLRLGCEFSPVYNMVSKAVAIKAELAN
jgi:uncharacterized OsmC-like protein